MNLDKLTSLLGSADMAARFVQMFKDQTPAQLIDLQHFASENNWQNVSIAAHALKGQLAYLDAENLRQLAYELECDAENGRGTTQQVANFVGQMANLLTELA